MTTLALLASIPAADPLPVPAPPALLHGLSLVTFFLHLLPMNMVLGGVLLALVNRVLAHRGNAHASALSAAIAKALPVLVAAAITFGIAPLLFLQVLYGRLFFPAAIALGAFWIAVIPLLIAGYYGTYASRSRTGVLIGAVVAAVFVTISLIYVNTMTLMLDPDRVLALHRASPAGLSTNFGDPSVVPRWLHMASGALAVSGLAVALYGASRRAAAPDFARFAIRQGAGVFLGGTAAGVISGAAWLFMLPREVAIALTMTDPVSATVLGLGVFSGLCTLVLVGMALLAREPVRLLFGATATLAVTLVLMIVTRDQLRTLFITKAGFTPAADVQTQVVPLGLFVVLLLAAVGIVAWLVSMIVRARPASGQNARVACPPTARTTR